MFIESAADGQLSPDVIGRHRPHIYSMEQFDFDRPADMFSGDRKQNKRQPMLYRRFRTTAEAIQFAVEGQAADRLRATIIEADGFRIDADEIGRLYASEDYPLVRRKAN